MLDPSLHKRFKLFYTQKEERQNIPKDSPLETEDVA